MKANKSLAMPLHGILWSLALLALWPLVAHCDYPCPFIDSVNISGSYPISIATHNGLHGATHDVPKTQPSNVSYVYKWMVVPPHLVAVYDFVVLNGVRVPAERHLRACVCRLKPCLRFCCAPGFYYDLEHRSCSLLPGNGSVEAAVEHYALEVSFRNGSMGIVNASSQFLVTQGVPCEHMRATLRDNLMVDWLLHENGSIIHNGHIFTRHYCYSPYPLRSDGDAEELKGFDWRWEPLACVPERLQFVLGVREWTYAICLIITVICMIVILFVYLICTEMRNSFFGVAIKTYCLCIIIGYSLLAHMTLTNPIDMSRYSCTKLPLFALLYLLLSFYILTFVSFNFYLSLFGIILSKLMFWFVFFPIVVVVGGWSFYVSLTTYNSKPVFAGDCCWFDPRNYSIVVYFYAPILVASIVSGIFYILSLMRMNEMVKGDINKLTIFATKNRFNSFWKFFSYTLLTWLVCMCSFAISYYRGEKTHINYVVCLFVGFHGLGAMYALIGKNNQIQHFFRHIEDDEDSDEMAEISVPMTTY